MTEPGMIIQAKIFGIRATEKQKNWPYGWIEPLYFQYFVRHGLTKFCWSDPPGSGCFALSVGPFSSLKVSSKIFTGNYTNQFSLRFYYKVSFIYLKTNLSFRSYSYCKQSLLWAFLRERLLPLCTFFKSHIHLEANSARSFQNVFEKCPRVRLVFSRNRIFHEHRHINLSWYGYHINLSYHQWTNDESLAILTIQWTNQNSKRIYLW